MADHINVMFLMGKGKNSTIDNTLMFLEDEDVIIAHYVMVGVCAAYIPIIIGFNFLVLWGIILYPGFHNPNNYLILSLSVADLLTGCFCLPMYMLSYLPQTHALVFANKYVCLTWFASIEIGPGGSVFSLFFITIDRYIAVILPLRYSQLVTVSRTMKAIVFEWCFVSLLAFSPMLFDWNMYDPTLLPLSARCNFHTTLPKPYVIFATFGSVLTVLFICTILYVHIIIVSQRQARAFRHRLHIYNPEEIQNYENHLSSIKMTSFLMLLFVLLLAPYMVVAPFKYYNVVSQKNIEIMRVATLLLTFSNAVVNVPIYALFRKEYRNVYKLMISKPPQKWSGALRVLYNDHHSSIFSMARTRKSSSVPHDKPFSLKIVGSFLKSLQVRDQDSIKDSVQFRGIESFEAKTEKHFSECASSVDYHHHYSSLTRSC